MSALAYADLVTADYATGTAVVNALQSESPDAPTALVATALPGAITFAWTLGTFWELNGIVELWENTVDNFATATKIYEARADSVTLQKRDATSRYYWARVRSKTGATSSTYPATNGLAAAASVLIQTFQDQSAGPITKSVTAPASNATYQVFWVDVPHVPTAGVEVTVTFRLGITGPPGVFHADVAAMWGPTSGSGYTLIGQKIVKDTNTGETITLVGNLPPGSVVGSATRRFGVGVDIFGDGINNIDAVFRDVTVVARATFY